MPDTGVIKIYAPAPGTILTRNITQGGYVARGQSLYTIVTDVHRVEGGEVETAILEGARQRKAMLQGEIEKTTEIQENDRRVQRDRVTSLRAQLASIDDQIGAERERMALAENAVARYTALLSKDYVTRDEAEQRVADLLDEKAKLGKLRRDRAVAVQDLSEATTELGALPLRQQNQVSQLERSIRDIEQSVIEHEAKGQIVVVSPMAGIAAAIIAEAGQTVDTVHPLASVVPSDARWQVQLFVPSSAVGFIHVGDSVLIRYDAYPYQKFGQYGGRIVSIAQSALTAAELNASGVRADTGTFFRVTVSLKSQYVKAYGRSEPLQSGMPLRADILQDHRRLYEWIFEPLYSLAGHI